MRFLLLLLAAVLITPLSASASTLVLPDAPATEGDTVLIYWHPSAGSYRITAERLNQSGTVLDSETTTFVVEEIPEPEPARVVQGTSTVESSGKIQEAIANIVPQAAVATPVFGAIDNLRQKGADALAEAEVWAKAKGSKQESSEVAGANTEAESGIASTVMALVATALSYLLALLKMVVSSAGIFYPVFAIVFFYILWRLFKRMRRSNY